MLAPSALRELCPMLEPAWQQEGAYSGLRASWRRGKRVEQDQGEEEQEERNGQGETAKEEEKRLKEKKKKKRAKRAALARTMDLVGLRT